MKNVMVIGANGFLGSQLSMRLSKYSYNVTALVAYHSNYTILSGYANIDCIAFDLSSLHEINGIKDIDTIYHMAWEGVGSPQRNEADIQIKNVQYGLSVMELAAKYGIRKVIIPGSASEYACGQETITGLNKPAPSDMYSAAKVATRYLCQSFAQQNDIDLIWTAITSIYGPGRDDNNLISYTIKTLLRGGKPSYTGLEQRWDFLYIEDLIDALIALGENGKGGNVYPIGSGENKQMLEYVKIIRDKINPELPLGIGDFPYKNKIIDNQVLDISALKTEVGFSPKFTFDHGIDKTIDYFRMQLK